MTRFDGALLRTRRQELGLTVEELADLTGLSKMRAATLEDFEADRNRPSMSAWRSSARRSAATPTRCSAASPTTGTTGRPNSVSTLTAG